MVTVKREVLKDVQVTRKTFRKLDDILAIEEALTRISNQLTKAIKQQNALLANDAKLQLLKVQTEKVKASLDATNGTWICQFSSMIYQVMNMSKNYLNFFLKHFILLGG